MRFDAEENLSFIGFLQARQPSTDQVWSWEAARTAHIDQRGIDHGAELAGIPE